MPRYFFRYTHDGRSLFDEHGEVFDGPAGALSHAWRVAAELARNAGPTRLRDCAMVVEDENGREIFEVDVSALNEGASLPLVLRRPGRGRATSRSHFRQRRRIV
jgi:hypothetical protein